MNASPTTASPVVRSPAPERQEFLDGIRGLAALYVTLGHANQQIGWVDLNAPLSLFTKSLKMGHYAVAVFIVLSGYCLMLPVARLSDGGLRGGFGGYIRRRALRILPAYFATLAVCLTVITLSPRFREPNGILWDVTLPALTPEAIVSHLVLAHNWDPDWVLKINAPMWSVATEWQIYFAFPLLLLVWRRRGMAACVLLAFAIGYGLFLLSRLTGDRPSMEACPWYLGLFALGMAAAQITTRNRLAPNDRRVWGWGLGAAGLAAMAVGVSKLDSRLGLCASWQIPQRVILDSLFGLSTALLLILLANLANPDRQHRFWAIRLLESRPMLWLGSFSYSLYLVNDPLLAWANIVMKDAGLADMTRYQLTFLAVVPAVVVFSYLFYLAVERPFTRRRK